MRSVARSRSNWNLECWVLRRRENHSNRRKTSRSKERTNNKLNLHITSGPRFEPGLHWWEASAFITTPPLLPFGVVQCIFEGLDARVQQSARGRSVAFEPVARDTVPVNISCFHEYSQGLAFIVISLLLFRAKCRIGRE